MAQSKAKTQRIAAIVIIAFNIVGIGLVLIDLVNNISYEIKAQEQWESAIQEVTPTPIPTLTEDELRELYDQPVGEEGNE